LLEVVEMTIADFNRYGEDIERIVRPRTSPLAVKMLRSVEDIPPGAVRPKRDRNHHLAQCQAFALSRRQNETVAMLKEDNWCFAPLVAYGLVDKPGDPDIKKFTTFPAFERGKYVGIVSSPLRTANFEPDVVIIYSDPAQLRNMLLPVHYKTAGDQMDSHFFPPSCAYLLVPPMETGRYMVALPDFGECDRALAADNEIILSVPRARIAEFFSGLLEREQGKLGPAPSGYMMVPDFPQPPFYRRLFARWGLDAKE
jgi:uncharacterized protein (DUF169 family)